MSEKPSLYVVEKKEVIILVVLFVLVTVLSFTLGVRYGESVGKKQAHEQADAAKLHGEEGGESGGTLGKSGEGGHPEAASAHGEAKDSHGDDKDEHGAEAAGHGSGHEAKADQHGAASEHGAAAQHGEAHGDSHAEATPKPDKTESHSPEAAAHSSGASSGSHEAVDKNSDEYLLNALKEAGVEPPGGKAPKDAKLPDSVKEAKRPSGKDAASRIRSGAYVIQVGSHPTRSEAESQVKTLKARKVNAEILSPFRDKQGEWHRVVIGSFKNKHEAEREATGLKGKGSIVSYFVWRLP